MDENLVYAEREAGKIMDEAHEAGICLSPIAFGEHNHTAVTYLPLDILPLARASTASRIVKDADDGRKIGLYVHIPFCPRKCYYCSYVTEIKPSSEKMHYYLNALYVEIEKWGKNLASKNSISSVYIGGGTPTILDASDMEELITKIYSNFNCDSDTSICVEANPATLSGGNGKKKLENLVQLGVTRLSMGIQTFDDKLLHSIGRSYYSGESAIDAVILAKQAGFDTVNIDLMSDLPGQTLEDIEADLNTIESRLKSRDSKPDSITWYRMKISPDCAILKTHPSFSEAESLKAKIIINKRLKELGYIQTSGDRFCLEGHSDLFKQARSGVNLLGLGVSAYSCMSHSPDSPLPRWIFRNIMSIDSYINAAHCGRPLVATASAYPYEEALVAGLTNSIRNGTKLCNVIDSELFGSGNAYFRLFSPRRRASLLNERFFREALNKLYSAGFLDVIEEENTHTIKLTKEGLLFENEILTLLHSPITREMQKGKKFSGKIRKVMRFIDSFLPF